MSIVLGPTPHTATAARPFATRSGLSIAEFVEHLIIGHQLDQPRRLVLRGSSNYPKRFRWSTYNQLVDVLRTQLGLYDSPEGISNAECFIAAVEEIDGEALREVETLTVHMNSMVLTVSVHHNTRTPQMQARDAVLALILAHPRVKSCLND